MNLDLLLGQELGALEAEREFPFEQSIRHNVWGGLLERLLG
jgi:hypothetical protein